MALSRLHRSALAVAGVIVTLAAMMTLGGSPEHSPLDAPRQADRPDALSPALRRCAALEGDRIEEAGCMAVWEENRRRFFGEQARSLAPATAPVSSAQEGGAPASIEPSRDVANPRPPAASAEAPK